jgi:phospholipid transport system substrate-binding protein
LADNDGRQWLVDPLRCSAPWRHSAITDPGGPAKMTRRFFLILSLVIGSASLTVVPTAIAADANVFMSELWTNAVEVLSKKAPLAERLARFRLLFQADFDGPGIARFVLGRYWRSASEQEQQQFLKLFEDYVIFVYGTRLSNFNGETFKVRGSRTDESGTIVSTDIVSPGGAAPLKVDWRLVADKGAFKINDVIIEGISMLVTQRSEFASVIQRHGGQIGELLAMMRERTRTASAAQ